MKLFRGDNINKSTEPGRYYFDGIRTKSFGQGTPRYIKPEALLLSIRQHINPVTAMDRLVYEATEFLSFSLDEKRAYYWLSDQSSVKLTPSTVPYEETRFFFELELNECDLTSLDKDKTMFIYRFVCNPSLKLPNSSSMRESLLFSAIPNGQNFRSCPLCNGTRKEHQIVLIDALKYLNIYKSDVSFDGAIVNAENDKEWLILPVDKLESFSGTTIPRADFWSVKHYAGEGEKRDPYFHEIKGIEFDNEGNVV